jgi:putative endonuclease
MMAWPKEYNCFMAFYVYILRTSSNTLYIGQTNNLENRIKEHKNKSSKSAKYVRYFTSVELVYSEKHSTRSKAMLMEAELKRWPKRKKEALIGKVGEGKGN